MVLSIASMLGTLASCNAVFLSNEPTRVMAANQGNWYIQNIYAREETTHGIYFGAIQNQTGYSSTDYFSTGIKVYSKDNTGATYGSSNLKVSSNQFYIDFTEANTPRYGSSPENQMKFDIKWHFSVTRNGVTYFYEDFAIDDPFDSTIKTKYAVYSGYGISTKRTNISDDGSNITDAQVNPRYFGKRALNLTDGEYSVKIDREYYWINTDGTVIYHSTSKMEVNLIVDGTLPSITMVDANGKTIQNGGFANRNVTVTAKDAHLSGLYCKEPGASSYSGTSSTYTTKGRDGWYYFYAKDFVDSETDVYSFYLDTTLPVGSVSSDGKQVANGSYISNSFAYTASDFGSGINKAYCKSPISGTFIEYALGSIIPSTAGDGWYEFYSTDKAGNASNHFKVYLETSKPVFTLYRNGVASFSSPMENGKEYDTGIYFNRSDILKIGCVTSSGVVSSNYQVNVDYKIFDESNKIIAINVKTATGIASKFICCVIDDKPYLTIGGKRYEDGSVLYFNKDVIAGFSPDSIQKGDSETGVTINGVFSSYSAIQTKELTVEEGKTNSYSISMNDRAGNVSKFTIIIDKESPSAKWVDGEGNLIANNGFTNKNVNLDYEEGSSAIYSYNGNEYQAYPKGTVFSKEGNYIVVLTDKAGNKSTYSLTIDKTEPIGKLYSDYEEVEDNSSTNGKVYFTWDEDCVATINGIPYSKNKVISEEGEYEFVLTDKAGNSSSYHVEIDLTGPSFNKDVLENRKNHLVSSWYNVEFDGKVSSFAIYEEALDYASGLEYQKYVTQLELDDVKKFTQTNLIASGSVHVGTYYRYKSVSSEENELYYFDEEGLMDAVRFYAKSHISGLNHFDLDKSDYGEIAADSMYSDAFENDGAEYPLLNGYAFKKEDSVQIEARLKGEKDWSYVNEAAPFEVQFTKTGVYEIKETDAAGNETVYEAFLDLSSPDIQIDTEIFGEGGKSRQTIGAKDTADVSAYYYKSFSIKEIIDNDPYAMVAVSYKGKKSYYQKGDSIPPLTEGGEYEVEVYDRLRNSYSFKVYIVGKEPEVSFKNNSDNTAFSVDVSLDQKFDAIVSLEIFKDDKKLDSVSPDITHYDFDKGGTYKVIIKDNFGRVVEKTYQFDKALPKGNLSVENGSKTKKNVNFSFDSSKYFAEVYKDGSLVEKNVDGHLSYSEDGKYSIKLINNEDLDNFSSYSFEIDNKAPSIFIDGAKGNGKTNNDVSVSWGDKDVVDATYSVNGGEKIEFEKETIFSEEGTYVVKVKDDLGNESIVTFVIDKTLDYSVNDAKGELPKGKDATTNQDVTIANHEDLTISVTKDGKNYPYSFGGALTEEGTYRIEISDELGNRESFQITIDKSVRYSSNVKDGDRTNDDVSFSSDEKATVIVTKDGNAYSYELGGVIKEEGEYVVRIYDSYGNEETIRFAIDKSVDASANVENGSSTNSDVTVSADEEVSVVAKKDGEEFDYKLGDKLTEDGNYEIVLRDSLGNEETISFTIDKTAPEITISGIDDGGKGDSRVTLSDMTEEGEIHVYKDGQEIEYRLGDELFEYGKYEVIVKDKLGNSRTYSFELCFQANGAVIALIGVGIALIAGAVVLVVMKKKRVFKK